MKNTNTASISDRLLLKIASLTPQVYAALISAAATFHFSLDTTPFIFVFSFAFAIQLILFWLCDFCNKSRRRFLFPVLIAVWFALARPIASVYESIMSSESEYLMDDYNKFLDWFFTGGSFDHYCAGYCCMLLIYASLFAGLAVYYYTHFYFRASIMFTLAMFPPIIYAKDYETLPLFILLPLIAVYFIMAIYCGSFRALKGTRVVVTKAYYASISVFLVFALAVAFFCPKPDIDDRRAEFDKFTLGGFSSSYSRIVDDYTSTSSGNGNSPDRSTLDLFYAYSSEHLNLKTQCFYYYDSDEDYWTKMKGDSVSVDLERRQFVAERSTVEMNFDTVNPALLLSDIAKAAQSDSDFAEKYGLDGFEGEIDPEGNEKNFSYGLANTVNSVTYSAYRFSPEYVLSPNDVRMASVKNCPGNFNLTRTLSEIFIPTVKTDNDTMIVYKYTSSTAFSFNYFSQSTAYEPDAYELLTLVPHDEYGELLNDLYYLNPSYNTSIALDEYEYQEEYFTKKAENTVSDEIIELAEEITAGLDSDIEKAKAIEMYFYNSGYEYDIDYKTPKGKNVEDFIFNSKRGSCYHYATAMVLLCRAAGLNARYCEGFMLNHESKGYTGTMIRESDSHAFPEVYISGYGWMNFEPTISDENGYAIGTVKLAAIVGGIMLFGILLAVFVACVIYPFADKSYLKYLLRKKRFGELSSAVISRLKKATDSSDACSSLEIVTSATTLSNFDIVLVSRIFDKLTYGGYPLSDEEAKLLCSLYFSFKDSLREKNKRQKRMKIPADA